MKEKIKEVHDYFKEKLLNGDFTVVSLTNYKALIEIDEYPFWVWTANIDIPDATDIYDGAKSFMGLNLDFDDKKKLSRIFREIITANEKEILEDKKAKYQEELENITNKLKALY
jgi:hypothetical protein